MIQHCICVGNLMITSAAVVLGVVADMPMAGYRQLGPKTVRIPQPLVTQEHIDFVCEHGNDQDATLNYQKGETVRLCVKTIEGLEDSEDANVSRLAKDLLRIIDENPNRLLKDEVNEILAPLGIKMTREPQHLAYYRNSGRLSLNSYASTKDVVDTTRWALIAPPRTIQEKWQRWLNSFASTKIL